jgi:hypothetical protein
MTSQTKKGAKNAKQFSTGHVEGNCHVANPTDVTDKKKGTKMQKSFLPGHGEGNCRVTNPTDVTDKKGREKCKTIFYLDMEKAIAA